MPSSDPTSIAKVLAVVDRIKPRSILDIGVGNGRYGFLFRELLDWNYGRLAKGDWWVKIEGVEIDPSYLTPVHDYVYDTVMVGDFNALQLERRYTLAFLGDVLEHWPDGIWRQALEKARWNSDFTLVVAPNHNGSLKQGAWCGHEAERHHVVLSPEKVGGRCLFATSKIFMCGWDNKNTGMLDSQDICL